MQGEAEGYFAADKHILLCLIIKILPETLIYKMQFSDFRLNHSFQYLRSLFSHMCALMGSWYTGGLAKAPSSVQGRR